MNAAESRIHIVGVGGDGLAGLTARTRELVQRPDLLLGADAVLDLVPGGAAERYPGYGFENHKGYGTAEHLEALRSLGPCPLHRRSFAPVAQREFDFG